MDVYSETVYAFHGAFESVLVSQPGKSQVSWCLSVFQSILLCLSVVCSVNSMLLFINPLLGGKNYTANGHIFYFPYWRHQLPYLKTVQQSSAAFHAWISFIKACAFVLLQDIFLNDFLTLHVVQLLCKICSIIAQTVFIDIEFQLSSL